MSCEGVRTGEVGISLSHTITNPPPPTVFLPSFLPSLASLSLSTVLHAKMKTVLESPNWIMQRPNPYSHEALLGVEVVGGSVGFLPLFLVGGERGGVGGA